jgi:elongation factor Ts
MAISVEAIKELRDMTSASIANCKKALEEAGGDIKKAAGILRKKGLEVAVKRQDKGAKEGRVESYIHTGNKIGVLVEIASETDFVARNESFVQFAKDVAMQIAACDPEYIKKEDVPHEVIEQEKNKEEFLKTHCLLEQPFIKDASLTINDYLGELLSKFGENISIKRFARFKIGR